MSLGFSSPVSQLLIGHCCPDLKIQSTNSYNILCLNFICRIDVQGSGFITTEDFMKILSSRDLGLQLNVDELQYLIGESQYENGYVPFVQVAPELPEMLRALYYQRAEQSMVRKKQYT